MNEESLLVLNDSKTCYFERYSASREERSIKNSKLITGLKLKDGTCVKGYNDFLSVRYIAKDDNHIEVYAYDSTNKLFVMNNGKKHMFVMFNGIEMVLPPKKKMLLMKYKPSNANSSESIAVG